MKQQMFVLEDGSSVMTFMKMGCVPTSTRTCEAQAKKIVFSGWMNKRYHPPYWDALFPTDTYSVRDIKTITLLSVIVSKQPMQQRGLSGGGWVGGGKRLAELLCLGARMNWTMADLREPLAPFQQSPTLPLCAHPESCISAEQTDIG